jgi:peptide/nickel transport system permease protein
VIRYLARRILHAVIVLWAAFTVSFLVMNLAPGNPVVSIIGAQNMASTPPSEIQSLEHLFGLNKPLAVQYMKQLWHVLHFDLGV